LSTILNSDGTIQDPYRNYIALSRYARYLEAEKRRETWAETVDRYFTFMTEHLAENFDHRPDKDLLYAMRHAVLQHDVMPSMRAVMTAGDALELSHIAGFNCSYLPLQDIRAFSELLYILMNGTGVGFSVENYYVAQLPVVPDLLRRVPEVVVNVGDSKLGWAEAFDELLRLVWVDGIIPSIDMSEVRPAGARLRTFGGRASGPEPLQDLFEFTIKLLHGAAGRRIRPIEAHDLACKVASVIVVGGVRRSAMISLSDLHDREMAEAKSGEWWVEHPYRALANNSAVYSDNMSREAFDAEWANLVASGSGERGIFHRGAAQRQAGKYGRRDEDVMYGTNPCSEIILRPFSFCNLSEVVVREDDTEETLARKVELATILGTWQSTLTDYPFLRQEWHQNAEEERLLGVSLTGVFGSEMLVTQPAEKRNELIDALRELAADVNAVYADELGINRSHAITCVKPSGTVSQLTGVSSGLHTWHSEYYIRRVRADKKDPLSQLMQSYGVPCEDDVMSPSNNVFSFPIKAPSGAITRDQISAVDHLRLWLDVQRHWCDHKPSVTISVRTEEWDEVGEWVWEHLAEISGVSFLPHSDHTYKQAPYTECSREEYEELLAQMPAEIHWEDLPFWETEDSTVGSQELACTAGACEVVDLVAG
jgi:ribonucleoside-diphosphate reductase alpha chain